MLKNLIVTVKALMVWLTEGVHISGFKERCKVDKLSKKTAVKVSEQHLRGVCGLSKM